MVRVSALGQLGRGVGGNLASDIFNIVSGVTGVIADAVDSGQGGGQQGGQMTAAQLQQIQAQQAAAAAAAKAEADRKMWTYIGVGAGVLLIGGGLIYAVKRK